MSAADEVRLVVLADFSRGGQSPPVGRLSPPIGGLRPSGPTRTYADLGGVRRGIVPPLRLPSIQEKLERLSDVVRPSFEANSIHGRVLCARGVQQLEGTHLFSKTLNGPLVSKKN